jgi:hypothetical protein
MRTKTANNYTQREINELKEAIRSGKPYTQIAQEFSVAYNRSYAGVYMKVCSISKKTRKRANTLRTQTVDTKSLSFQAKRIEINSNGTVTLHF